LVNKPNAISVNDGCSGLIFVCQLTGLKKTASNKITRIKRTIKTHADKLMEFIWSIKLNNNAPIFCIYRFFLPFKPKKWFGTGIAKSHWYRTPLQARS
jgi:hypothetical protein